MSAPSQTKSKGLCICALKELEQGTGAWLKNRIGCYWVRLKVAVVIARQQMMYSYISFKRKREGYLHTFYSGHNRI